MWDNGCKIKDIMTRLKVSMQIVKKYAFETRNGDVRQPKEEHESIPGKSDLVQRCGKWSFGITMDYTEEENVFLRRVSDYRSGLDGRLMRFEDFERIFLEMHGIEWDETAKARYYRRLDSSGMLRTTERYRLLRKVYGI